MVRLSVPCWLYMFTATFMTPGLLLSNLDATLCCAAVVDGDNLDASAPLSQHELAPTPALPPQDLESSALNAEPDGPMILLDTWPGNNDPLWAVKATNIGIGNSISQTPQFAPPLSSSLFAAATPANPQLPAVTNPATLTGAPGSPTPPSGGNAPVTQHNDATTKLPATSGNTLYHFVYVHDGTSEIFDVIDINSLRSSLDAREASEYEQNSRASSTLGDGRASPILLLFPIVTITAGHILTLLL